MRYPRRFLKNWLKIFELDTYRARCSVSRPKRGQGIRKDDAAVIDISLGEKKLEIFLNPKNRKAWTEGLIVHELTHVFLYRLWDFVDHLIRKGFHGKKAQEALRTHYESLEEEAVDRLVGIFLKLKKQKSKKAPKSKIRVLEGRLGKKRLCA